MLQIDFYFKSNIKILQLDNKHISLVFNCIIVVIDRYTFEIEGCIIYC